MASSSCSVGSPTSLTQRHRPPPSVSPSCIRYAVLGAGFAGLSVAWHLLIRARKTPTSASTYTMKLESTAACPGFPNAQSCLASCRIETLDKDAAQSLIPGISPPLDASFYMPEAVNIHPQCYLQALFLACQNLVKELCGASGSGVGELHLHKSSVRKLLDLEGEYKAVIVCLGAKADMLPELCGRLPLRLCRGVVAHLQLPDDIGEAYPSLGPLILSDAWLAVQGPRCLYMGSTWEWKSRNSSPNVFADEAREALKELLPRARAIYPVLKDWKFAGARAGLRAMPPLTPPFGLCR